jgi:HEAT repeat protein
MSINTQLIDKLYNPSKALRFNALKEIIKTHQRECIPVVRKFLFLEKDKDLIFYARKSLDLLTNSLKKGISTINVSDHEFIQILYSGSSTAKIDTLKNLIQLNKKKFISYLVDCLTNEKDVFVIATLIKGVGYLGDKSNIEQLVTFLDSNDSRIRSNSVEAISILGKEGVLPIILPLLKDNHPRVKITAANYLITYSEEINIDEIIEKMSFSKSLSENSAVLFLIDKIRAPKFSKVLEHLSNHKNKEIKNKAVDILEKISKLKISTETLDELELIDKMIVQKPENFEETTIKTIMPDTFHTLIKELFDNQNPDKLKKIILKLEKLGDTRSIEPLKNLNSDSKVVNYFILRALEKLESTQEKIIMCPNCGYQIRKNQND